MGPFLYYSSVSNIWCNHYERLGYHNQHHYSGSIYPHQFYYMLTFIFMNTLFFFRIIISGASGANGRKNEANGKANQIRALVHLEANETLFLLIGQMGSSACEQTGVS